MSLKTRDSFTIINQAEGYFDNTQDKFVKGIETSTQTRGNIQPYKEQVKEDPKLEGVNLTGAIKVYSPITPIYAISQDPPREASKIIWKNKTYKIQMANEWLTHYEGVAILEI